MSGFDRARLPDAAGYFAGEGLTLMGPGKWRTTNCLFHGGSDSMRVQIEYGAWVCMACGAKGGDVLAYHMQVHDLEFVEAARALGAWVDGGVDGRSMRAATRRPPTFSLRAALEVLEFEALLVAVAAGNIAQGVALTDADRMRVMQAAGRIGFIATEVRA